MGKFRVGWARKTGFFFSSPKRQTVKIDMKESVGCLKFSVTPQTV